MSGLDGHEGLRAEEQYRCLGVDLEDVLNSRLDIVALHKQQVPHLHSALTKLLVEELCLELIS